MKSSLVAAGLLMTVPSAHALLNFTTSQLDLTNTLAVTYDSNLTGGAGFSGAATNKEDTYVTYSPRLDFIRKAGLIHLESNAEVDFLRYFDQTNLNSEDVSAGLQLSLAEAFRGAYTGSVGINYTEGATVESDVNTRVRSDTLSFNATGQVQLSRRMVLSGGTSYSNSRRSGGSDTETLGANAQWSLQDFLRGTALRLGYTYNYTHSDASLFSPISIDQTSHQITAGLSRPLFPYRTDTTIFADVGYRFLERSAAEKRAGLTGDGGVVFNVGITGPFLPRERFPKLQSSLSLSYSQSPSPGLNDDDERSLQGNLALDWQARERTKLGVAASQTRSLTVSNLTQTSSALDFHVNQRIGEHLNGTVTVAYNWSTYDAPLVSGAPTTTAGAFAASFAGQARKDETLSFTGSLTYAFARVWSSSVRYEYRQVSSSSAFGDYDHHLASLNISCRY